MVPANNQPNLTTRLHGLFADGTAIPLQIVFKGFVVLARWLPKKRLKVPFILLQKPIGCRCLISILV